MAGLPEDKKGVRIRLAVSIQYMNVTDKQTSHDSIGIAVHTVVQYTASDNYLHQIVARIIVSSHQISCANSFGITDIGKRKMQHEKPRYLNQIRR